MKKISQGRQNGKNFKRFAREEKIKRQLAINIAFE